MKILMISSKRFELDGITNVILNYYRAINKKDIKIDFAIPNEINADLRLEIESLNSNIFVFQERMRNPLLYISNLKKLMIDQKYDIVHAHGNSCTLALEMSAAKLAGVKVRISHSHNSSNKYKLVHKILRPLFERTYTHGFACSSKAGEWLFKKRDYKLIRNGIFTNVYQFNEKVRYEYRRQYNLEGYKVVGHVGHFTYQKNHDFIIETFKELYETDRCYRLVLVGDGELKKDIEDKVAKLHLENAVLFMGRSFETPKLMQAMDLILMPSRFEGLPLTLIEAQTAGLPCFVSDVVSNEVKLTDLVKFCSLDKTPKQWAETILKYDIPSRENNSIENLNKVLQSGYSIEENADDMKKLYVKYFESVKQVEV